MSVRNLSPNRLDLTLKPDGDTGWREIVVAAIADAANRLEAPVIVDVGCGVSSWALERAKIDRGTKIGVDLDPEAMSNKDVDRVLIASADNIPLPDATADLVISSYVLEHLENPVKATREFARILKPGGRVILWAPNRLNYAIILSSLTPCWFHNWVRRRAGLKNSKDNCPTFYRANTPASLRRCLLEAGLEPKHSIRFGAGAYQYWAFSTILLGAAAIGSRMISSTPLRYFKSIMIADAVKPG